MPRFLILIALFTLALTADLSAQQPAESAAPAEPVYVSEADAAKLGPQNKAFIDKYLQYREILKNLNAWKVEYQNAAPARQQEIQSAYTQRFEEGEKLRRELLELGLAAFQETPNKNPYVADLLYPLVGYEYNIDNFEQSYRIFKTLLSEPLPPGADPLYVFAGISALMIMQLDDADAWLKKASESGALKKYMQEIAKDEEGQNRVYSIAAMVEALPEYRKSWTEEQAIRQREAEAAKDPEKALPRVLLKTSKGDIVLELFENEAPNTVANFISLVEKGYYKNVPFHRVLPFFMAQGGDPTGTGMGGPGYTIACECRKPGYRKHFRGSLSMAKTAAPDTGGSQFFLTFVPTTMLDGKHTVFGRVAEGMEVLARIQRVDPQDEKAVVPEVDKILEAKVLNKRNHPYNPVKLPNR